MSKEEINVGSGANTGDGDTLRAAFQKTVNNFNTLFAHANATDNPHSVTAAQIGAVTTGSLGIPSGVATLDGSGKLRAAQRPAYTLAEINEGDLGYSLIPSIGAVHNLGSTSKAWAAIYANAATTGSLFSNATTVVSSVPLTVTSTTVLTDGVIPLIENRTSGVVLRSNAALVLSATAYNVLGQVGSTPDVTIAADRDFVAYSNLTSGWNARHTLIFDGNGTLSVSGITLGYADLTLASGTAIQGHATESLILGVRSDQGLIVLDQSTPGTYTDVLFRAARNDFSYLGNAIYHEGNFVPSSKLDASAYTAADVLDKLLTVDGTGTDLDADLLDGQHGAYYRNFGNLTDKPTTVGGYGITDAVTTGAFANAYTAADVLDKLLTVDGPDTGLNADLLDGQHAAFFQNATNFNAGTLADARLTTNVPLKNAANIFTALQTITPSGSEFLNLSPADFGVGKPMLFTKIDGQADHFQIGLWDTVDDSGRIDFSAIELTHKGAAIWTTANDGDGSGLHADLLDGQHGTFYQNATNINAGTLAVARLPAFSGDASSSAGSSILTLASVNSNVGSYGNATSTATITVNAKGQVTAIANATITPPFSSITDKPTTLAGYGITDAQGLDGTLTALAGLNGTAGFLVQTGADAFTKRSLTVGSGLSLLNASGTSDNPSISLDAGLVSLADLSYTSGTNLIVQTADSTYSTQPIGTSTSSSIPDRSSADARYAQLSGSTFVGAVTLASDPTQPLHAATKQYVDNAIQGLDSKLSVRASSTANITLSAPGATLDGVSLVGGNRILLRHQNAPAENGVYVWTDAGSALVRSSDLDTYAEFPSAFVFVEEGTTYGNTGWVCVNDTTGTLGTTAIDWTQFSGAGTYTAGTGLELTGGAFALDGQALAFHLHNANGLLVRTGAGAFASRSISVGTGLGISNADGTGGNISISVADDLAAIEALSGTGFAVRTAGNTWAQRSIAISGAGITVSNGSGVSGNPTLALNDSLASLSTQTWTSGLYVPAMYAANAWVMREVGLTSADSILSRAGGDGRYLGLAGGTLTGTVTVRAGSTSAAPIQFQAGSLLTTPTAHSMEWNGTNLFMTQTAGSRKTIQYADDSIAWGRLTGLGTTLTFYGINDAAGILTQLLTVDGTGTSLDADLLDGQHGAYYRDFGNLTNTPTTLAGYGISDPVITAVNGLSWTSGTQVVALTSGSAATLVRIGSASGEILDKSAGDSLYLGLTATAANAALLNGQPGSHYLNSANLTGSINLTVLPDTLRDLNALSGGADLVPYWTGASDMATMTVTSTARTLLDDTSTSAMRTTLGLAIGSNVQAYDATLAALAGATWTAGTQIVTFTAADTISMKTVGSATGNILDKAAGDLLYQPLDATLTALAALNNTAGLLVQTGADTFARRTLVVGSGMSIADATGAAANPTITLDAGLVSLASMATTGVVVSTATDTFSTRSIGAATGPDILDRDAADARFLGLAGGTMTGAITLSGDPTNPLHATTKQYVDSAAQGLSAKTAAQVATTANITLSGLQTIDGYALMIGDRVLVKNQTTASQNGIYVAASGAWSRSADMNAWSEFRNAFVFIENGADFAYTGWTTPGPLDGVLDTTDVVWSQFSGAAEYTGASGIALSGTEFSLTGQARALHDLATSGLIVRTGAGTVTGRTLTGTTGVSVTNGNGVSGNPTLALSNDLAAVEGIATTGFVRRTATDTWSAAAIANSDLPTSGVTASTYRSVTVNAQGIVTAGSNPTTLAGYGITDAQGLDAGLTSIAGLTGAGVLTATATDSFAMRAIGASSSTDILDRAAADTRYPILIAGTNTFTGAISLNSANPSLRFVETDQTAPAGGWFFNANNDSFYIRHNTANPVDFSTMNIVMTIGSTEIVNFTNTPTAGGVEIWHANNDGTGSGLDADLLDGQQGSFYQSASNLTAGTLAAARMPALTGDITTSAGAVATTLATVNSNVGAFGNATHVGAFTVNGKGLTTAASAVLITPDWSSVASKPTTLSGFGITDAMPKSGGEFTGAISFLSTTPLITFKESDRVDGSGYYRFTSSGGIFSIRRNTSVASDFGTEILELSISSSGGVNFNTTPTVGADNIWHAGNDGTGSGLDADLLDGQQGSFYQSASNINAGTLNQARLPTSTGTLTTFSGGLILSGYSGLWTTSSYGKGLTIPKGYAVMWPKGAGTYSYGLASNADHFALLASTSDDNTGTMTTVVMANSVSSTITFGLSYIDGTSTNGPRIVNGANSTTVPKFTPNRADAGTGIGTGGTGQLALIASSTEAVRITSTATTVNTTLAHNGLVPTSGTAIDQILTVTDSITLSTSWQDTSVNATDLASGSYMVQVLVGSEYHTGVMSWYASDTNDTISDEVQLHRAGVVDTTNTIYLRVARTLTASASDLKLQISSDQNDGSASSIQMKFRRMI